MKNSYRPGHGSLCGPLDFESTKRDPSLDVYQQRLISVESNVVGLSTNFIGLSSTVESMKESVDFIKDFLTRGNRCTMSSSSNSIHSDSSADVYSESDPVSVDHNWMNRPLSKEWADKLENGNHFFEIVQQSALNLLEELRDKLSSELEEDKLCCDNIVYQMAINRYADGTDYSKKIKGKNAITLIPNVYRDQFCTVVRMAQINFFNPQRPRNTGVGDVYKKRVEIVADHLATIFFGGIKHYEFSESFVRPAEHISCLLAALDDEKEVNARGMEEEEEGSGETTSTTSTNPSARAIAREKKIRSMFAEGFTTKSVFEDGIRYYHSTRTKQTRDGISAKAKKARAAKTDTHLTPSPLTASDSDTNDDSSLLSGFSRTKEFGGLLQSTVSPPSTSASKDPPQPSSSASTSARSGRPPSGMKTKNNSTIVAPASCSADKAASAASTASTLMRGISFSGLEYHCAASIAASIPANSSAFASVVLSTTAQPSTSADAPAAAASTLYPEAMKRGRGRPKAVSKILNNNDPAASCSSAYDSQHKDKVASSGWGDDDDEKDITKFHKHTTAETSSCKQVVKRRR